MQRLFIKLSLTNSIALPSYFLLAQASNFDDPDPDPFNVEDPFGLDSDEDPLNVAPALATCPESIFVAVAISCFPMSPYSLITDLYNNWNWKMRSPLHVAGFTKDAASALVDTGSASASSPSSRAAATWSLFH